MKIIIDDNTKDRIDKWFYKLSTDGISSPFHGALVMYVLEENKSMRYDELVEACEYLRKQLYGNKIITNN